MHQLHREHAQFACSQHIFYPKHLKSINILDELLENWGDGSMGKCLPFNPRNHEKKTDAILCFLHSQYRRSREQDLGLCGQPV